MLFDKRSAADPSAHRGVRQPGEPFRKLRDGRGRRRLSLLSSPLLPGRCSAEAQSPAATRCRLLLLLSQRLPAPGRNWPAASGAHGGRVFSRTESLSALSWVRPLCLRIFWVPAPYGTINCILGVRPDSNFECVKTVLARPRRSRPAPTALAWQHPRAASGRGLKPRLLPCSTYCRQRRAALIAEGGNTSTRPQCVLVALHTGAFARRVTALFSASSMSSK